MKDHSRVDKACFRCGIATVVLPGICKCRGFASLKEVEPFLPCSPRYFSDVFLLPGYQIRFCRCESYFPVRHNKPYPAFIFFNTPISYDVPSSPVMNAIWLPVAWGTGNESPEEQDSLRKYPVSKNQLISISI